MKMTIDLLVMAMILFLKASLKMLIGLRGWRPSTKLSNEKIILSFQHPYPIFIWVMKVLLTFQVMFWLNLDVKRPPLKIPYMMNWHF